MSRPRILLLQARVPNDPVLPEEQRIFARNAGVPVENVTPHDLLAHAPTLADARRHDAVMIGGSGEYFVSRADLPAFPAILEFLADLIAAGHPTFASCFGFQLIVRALGGDVEFLPEKMELGTYPLSLTGAGLADPLFGRLPPVFQAQLGHKDQVTRLPEGVLHLASSDLARHQAIRIPDRPIWATQFHPEVTRDENLGRFRRYLDLYAGSMDPAELQATLDRFQPSPDAEKLIPGFMQLVFG